MAKHLLYLTNHHLSEVVWENGVFSDPKIFDHYASGWLKFSEYFAAQVEPDVLILTDLIEEDFQRELIPHVFGSSRKSLINRRLHNLYRDTPYYACSAQGREKEGRRDDRVLFSALTNPQILQPWLDALQVLKIHVVGVYSVALLKPLMLKKLGDQSSASLLVTHQSSGLRQSFFQEGQLRFSRLSPETAWSAEAIAEVAEVELAKTRQFLASTRLLVRGEPLQIIVLAATEVIACMRERTSTQEELVYRFIELEEVRPLFLPKKSQLSLRVCDPLYLSLLARGKISSHYATSEQIRLHKLLQLRTTLNATSIAALVLASAWAVNDGVKALKANEMAAVSQAETVATSSKYQTMLASMPVTVANPAEMKAASELDQTILKNTPKMRELLYFVSEALAPLPQIKLEGLKWELISDLDSGLDSAVAVATPPDNGEMSLPAHLFGVPDKSMERLTLDCEIRPFNQDYRVAFASAEQFVRNLQRNSKMKVTMVKPPFDVRPDVKFEGKVGGVFDGDVPRFTVSIVWKP